MKKIWKLIVCSLYDALKHKVYWYVCNVYVCMYVCKSGIHCEKLLRVDSQPLSNKLSTEDLSIEKNSF